MKLETLVSCVDKDPEALAASMGLEGDAVIVNQCDRDGALVIEKDGSRIRIFECNERGVGKSRNKAMDEAEAGIILFSDEDIVYDKGYSRKILRCFEKLPMADILLFNLDVNEKRRTYHTERAKRVTPLSCGRYPAFCCAARLEALRKAGIRYSLLFGGGAEFQNGEDSLFFMDCLKKGLKIFALPVHIGREEERPSTWFKGYDEKFFFDRGVLYHFLYGAFAYIWGLRFVISKRKIMCCEVPPHNAVKYLFSGIRKGRELCRQ